jgi:hypothetical protein
LTVPLHTEDDSDNENVSQRGSNSIVHRPRRRGTNGSVGSEDFADKAAKLRIDFKGGRKSSLEQQRFSRKISTPYRDCHHA